MRIYSYKCVNDYCKKQWTDPYTKKAMHECPYCGCQVPPEAELLRVPDPLPIPMPQALTKKERRRLKKKGQLKAG